MATTTNTENNNNNGETETFKNENPSHSRHCGPKLNTQQRLFGPSTSVKSSPKRSDTFKSSIFDATPPKSPAKTPKKQIPVAIRNPITGEIKMPASIATN